MPRAFYVMINYKEVQDYRYFETIFKITQIYIDELVQKRRNSIAKALELHIFYINPSIINTEVQHQWHLKYCVSM